jgi:hypothetical protein
VHAAHRLVAQEGLALAGADRAHRGGHGQPGPRRAEDRAAGQRELRHAAGPAEGGPGHGYPHLGPAVRAGPRRGLAANPADLLVRDGDLRLQLAQGGIDAGAQLVAHDDVGDHGGQRDRHGHRGRRQQHDAPAKAHGRGARST